MSCSTNISQKEDSFSKHLESEIEKYKNRLETSKVELLENLLFDYNNFEHISFLDYIEKEDIDYHCNHCSSYGGCEKHCDRYKELGYDKLDFGHYLQYQIKYHVQQAIKYSEDIKVTKHRLNTIIKNGDEDKSPYMVQFIKERIERCTKEEPIRKSFDSMLRELKSEWDRLIQVKK